MSVSIGKKIKNNNNEIEKFHKENNNLRTHKIHLIVSSRGRVLDAPASVPVDSSTIFLQEAPRRRGSDGSCEEACAPARPEDET